MAGVGNRIAHLHFLRTFDVGRKVSRLTNFELITHVRFRIETADLFDFDVLARMKQFYADARLELTVENTHVGDDAFVSVKIRIERQSLKAGRARSLRVRDSFNDPFENLIDADAFLGAG